MEGHRKNGHVVGQNLLNLLRERFWIVRGRQAVKKILAKCAICQRYRAKPLEVESPPLPENRVRDANLFEICGVDLAGPLYLSDGSKVWITLFTCAIYRAVHLEIVSSLSTEAFMMCFRRFVALRERPSIVYSDNGLNFRGAHNALQELDWDKISANGAADRINWRFNPPRAAWWGGFWERLVGVIKVIIRKVLGKASLNHEELATVIYECATYVNQRPLTYLSENPEDPIVITLQMFLHDLPQDGVPDFDAVDSGSLKKKLQRRVLLKNEFRRRFRIEYLGQLNVSPGGFREKRSPKVGEVVLVGSESGKRVDWPIAVIEETIKGKDGKCRAVVLRTENGRLTRAIQHVYPMEMAVALDSDEDLQEVPAQTPVPDGQEDPGEDSGPLSASEDSVPLMQPEDSGSLSPPQETLKKPRVPKIKVVERVCETRCGRKVKLPIKFAV